MLIFSKSLKRAIRIGRTRATILAVGLGLLATLSPGAAQELANGSFEETDGEGGPASWILQPRGLTIDLDRSATEDDGRALRITDAGSGGSALIKQEIQLGDAGFAGATLRGRIRTRDITASATLVVILEGPDGRIFLDDMRDRVVAGDTEWQEYRIQIPASKEARSLTIGALAIGTGTAWFDDLELVANSEGPPVDVDPRAYVLHALSIMREHYLHAEDVDWDVVRERGLDALSESASLGQAHAAVSIMLETLNDPHTGIARARSPDAASTQFDDFEALTAEMASERIVLVRVPHVPGSTSEATRVGFAEKAHEALKAVDSPDVCGWIVDLRDNTGGNMWPMLAAIGPIAGPGILGQFVRSDGTDVTKWVYRDGAVFASTESETLQRIMLSIDPFRPNNAKLPVAVLVSGMTSSSGEATAIAFIGRDNARLFGSETGGLATANNVSSLSDGTRIIFPMGYMADRHGKVHYPAVQPHAVVPPENAIKAATSWLQSGESCTRA